MEHDEDKPRVFHILNGDALEVRFSPFGSVGTIFNDEGIEAVWVRKQDEEIDDVISIWHHDNKWTKSA